MRKFLAAVLTLFSLSVPAATINFYMTNGVTGLPDTNWFTVAPIIDPVMANGGILTKGPTTRVYPDTNGFASIFRMQGIYFMTNQYLGKGRVFAVPVGTGTNNVDDLPGSGFNTYNLTMPGWREVVPGSTNVIISLSNGTYTIDINTNVTYSSILTNQIILFTDPQGHPWSFNGQSFTSLAFSPASAAFSFSSDTETNPVISTLGSLRVSQSSTSAVPFTISVSRQIVESTNGTNLLQVLVNATLAAWIDKDGVFHNPGFNLSEGSILTEQTGGGFLFSDTNAPGKKAKIAGGVVTGDLSSSTNYAGSNIVGAVSSSLNAANLTGLVRSTNFESHFFTTNAPPVNVVRDFFADPTGTVPSQTNFQNAFDYVNAVGGGDIVIPTGTYLLNTNRTIFTNAAWHEIAVDMRVTGGNSIRFIGQGNPTILFTNSSSIGPQGTNDSVTALFEIDGSASLLQFDGINFIARHDDNPVSRIIAICQGAFEPPASMVVATNLIVQNCFFRDWGYCIYPNYVESVSISGNKYRYTHGRNEEQYYSSSADTAPAASIRTGPYIVSVDARNNDWLGSDLTDYTGYLMKIPMDNFFLGCPQKSTFIGNRIFRNAFEGIDIFGRVPKASFGNYSSEDKPGRHTIQGNIIDSDPQAGQVQVGYAGVSITDGGAVVSGNQIYNQYYAVHANMLYGMRDLRIDNNEIVMPSLATWGSLLLSNIFPAAIDCYRWTNLSIVNNKVFWPDRADPPWPWLTNTYPSAGVFLFADGSGEVSGNSFITPNSYTNAPGFPTNRTQLYGVWIDGSSTNIHVGRNLNQNMDVAVSVYEDPNFAAPAGISVDEQNTLAVRHPAAWSRFHAGLGVSEYEPRFHRSARARTESTSFYSAAGGWYRVLMASTNGAGNDMAGRLVISADSTNASGAHNMTYLIAANRGGNGHQLSRVSTGGRQNSYPLLSGIRVSESLQGTDNLQADIYLASTNTQVSLLWDDNLAGDAHLVSQPYAVSGADVRYNEMSDTNVDWKSISQSGNFHAYTLNGMPLELVPGGTNMFSSWTPFSGGLWLFDATNPGNGHHILYFKQPGGGALTLMNPDYGGAVQSNNIPLIFDDRVSNTRGAIMYRGASGWTNLAPSSVANRALLSGGTGADVFWGDVSTNAGTATNVVWTAATPTIGIDTNAQVVSPYVATNSIGSNLLSTATWSAINTIANNAINALAQANTNIFIQIPDARALTNAYATTNFAKGLTNVLATTNYVQTVFSGVSTPTIAQVQSGTATASTYHMGNGTVLDPTGTGHVLSDIVLGSQTNNTTGSSARSGFATNMPTGGTIGLLNINVSAGSTRLMATNADLSLVETPTPYLLSHVPFTNSGGFVGPWIGDGTNNYAHGTFTVDNINLVSNMPLSGMSILTVNVTNFNAANLNVSNLNAGYLTVTNSLIGSTQTNSGPIQASQFIGSGSGLTGIWHTNLVARSYYPTNFTEGTTPDAGYVHQTFITNASFNISGFLNVSNAFTEVFSLEVSNSAAGNITAAITAAGVTYFGSASTNSLVIPGGKEAFFSFKIRPNRTNCVNMVQQ